MSSIGQRCCTTRNRGQDPREVQTPEKGPHEGQLITRWARGGIGGIRWGRSEVYFLRDKEIELSESPCFASARAQSVVVLVPIFNWIWGRRTRSNRSKPPLDRFSSKEYFIILGRKRTVLYVSASTSLVVKSGIYSNRCR